MNPSDLVDQPIGPHHFRVCVENVNDFVRATGDEADRWEDAAPPGFMATLLFVVASDLLRQLADRSVIHGEQTFTWHRRMGIESEMDVTGRVSRVRERGGVAFVDFDVEVVDNIGPVASATSLFLVSAIADPGQVAERAEPAPEDDGSPGSGQMSISRAGLIRYAAATRDWNPIHWDHDAAVAAGLPGVVAHGLLQAAWALSTASRLRPGDSPLRSARVRFRSPLPSATPVSVDVEESGDTVVVAVGDDDAEYVSARIELTGQ
ncbi:MAG TPA: MaoC/PaaZ C-terminal domain-containing protein [Acidimicrobiia bacterium]|nr:MaoC/PaaZ C-terminal domain-containing protein [Acidimicrobiia bacterium]